MQAIVSSSLFILLGLILAFNPIYSVVDILSTATAADPYISKLKYLPYIFILGVFCLALLSAYQNRREFIDYKKTPLVITATVILILWTLLTFAWSPASLWQSARGFNVDFAGLLLFIAIWLWKPSMQKAVRLQWLMLSILIFLAVAAIPETINNSAFRSWAGHTFERHYVTNEVPQIRSLTTGPNPFGTLMTLLSALILLLVTDKRYRFGLLIFTGLTSGLTYARSAWLGTGLMGAGRFFQEAKRKVFLKWPAILATSMLIGVCFGAIRYDGDFIDLLFHGEFTEQHGEVAAKTLQKTAGQEFSLTVFGYGIGTSGPVIFNTSLEDTVDYPTITESWYLQIIQEIGLIGTALYGWMYFLVAKALHRVRPILGWLALGLAFNAIFLHVWSADPNINLMFWTLAGLCLFARPAPTPAK